MLNLVNSLYFTVCILFTVGICSDSLLKWIIDSS